MVTDEVWVATFQKCWKISLGSCGGIRQNTIRSVKHCSKSVEKKKKRKKEKQKKKKAPLGTTTSTGTVITYSGAMNIQEQCLISPFTNTFQAISSAACSGLKTFIFLLTTELKKERECIEKYIYDINDELVQVAIMAWNWDGIPAEMVNTLRPRQNGRHFADDVLKSILLNGNVWIPIKISLKFVPKGPIDNIPTLV